MKSEDVLALVKLMASHNIDICIDGGWGVDALLGEQTREHDDLDIAVQHKDVPQLRMVLKEQGYKEIPRNDSTEFMFVLADDAGRKIDVHSYTFDAKGSHIAGVEYPLESLSGEGVIGDQQVKCIAPEWVVKFHSGYDLDKNDYHDIKLVCQKFGLPLPEEYKKFHSL